jgi:hypothetical protein
VNKKRLPLDAVAAVFLALFALTAFILSFLVADKTPAIVAGVVAAVLLLLVLIFQPDARTAGYSVSRRARTEALAGRAAVAQVERIKTVNTNDSDILTHLDLIVDPQTEPYRAKTTHSIDLTAVPRFQPGMLLTVQVHPQQPGVVVVADSAPEEPAELVGRSAPLALPPVKPGDNASMLSAARGPVVPQAVAIVVRVVGAALGPVVAAIVVFATQR